MLSSDSHNGSYFKQFRQVTVKKIIVIIPGHVVQHQTRYATKRSVADTMHVTVDASQSSDTGGSELE